MITAVPQLERALRHHQLGELDAAERMYRAIIDDEPRHADALHLLGITLHQRRDNRAAVDYIVRAIAVDASEALFHSNLGAAYQALGDVDEAVKCFREAIRIAPDDIDTWHNLAAVLQMAGRFEEAIAAHHELLRLDPRNDAIRESLVDRNAECGVRIAECSIAEN